MLIKKLLKDIYLQEIPVLFQNYEITCICTDSRKVKPGALFVALKGTHDHGGRFIQKAYEQGAKVLAIEDGFLKENSSFQISHFIENISNGENPSILILKVPNVLGFLLKILNRFYVLDTLLTKIVGITGTNGKTTITYILEAIFNSAGFTTGVIGTINHRWGEKKYASKNTTPGIVENYEYLYNMQQDKISYCFMEVSSHALDQGRVAGINFCKTIFTNLKIDHLDYHIHQENYFLSKSLLFKNLTEKDIAIINLDDPYGKRLIHLTKAQVKTYGMYGQTDILAKDIKLDIRGTQFEVSTPFGTCFIKSSLIGMHNVYNMLAAISVGLYENIPLQQIKKGIESITRIPGRLEHIDCGQDFITLIDYAHTEDALWQILSSIKTIIQTRIILVFGCGGDRDKSKRAKMGKVANDLANIVIITNDNPRNEPPEEIIRQISKGFDHEIYEVIFDRKQAIEKSLSLARSGDVVLVAGKGHENYQVFQNERIQFDDREVIKQYFMKSKL